MKFDDMYQEVILDHYRNPHHAGLREPFDAEVHYVNPESGDEVTMRVTLRRGDDGAMIDDVSYQAVGCSIHQASASMMTDLVIGKTVSEAMVISDAFVELMHSRGNAEPDEDVLQDAVALILVSRYPARVKCARLCWMAWMSATTQALSQLD